MFGDLSLSTYLPAHPTWPESWCRHLYSDRQTDGKWEGEKEKEENLGERGINVTDQWRSTEQNRAELSGQQRWVKLQFEITFWSVTDLFWHHWDSLTSDYLDILGNAQFLPKVRQKTHTALIDFCVLTMKRGWGTISWVIRRATTGWTAGLAPSKPNKIYHQHLKN